jgi:hypothetical protein
MQDDQSGVYDAGSRYDTLPQNGCCTATLVAVGEPSRNERDAKFRALQSGAVAIGKLVENKARRLKEKITQQCTPRRSRQRKSSLRFALAASSGRSPAARLPMVASGCGIAPVTTPQLGHATYLFSRPASMSEFLAIYSKVAKEDILRNRGNGAEKLGFLGRFIHGVSPSGWLKELRIRLGETMDYAEAPI